MRAFWALKNLQTRRRHQQISWCSFHSSLCVPIYQSEQTCVRRYLKSSPNAESASLAVSPFSLSSSFFTPMWVRVSVIYFTFFIAFRFMTLRKRICTHVSKPLCKLLGENKQQKQLIDRAKPNFPTVPFRYHFDLYGGILTKTLVE